MLEAGKLVFPARQDRKRREYKARREADFIVNDIRFSIVVEGNDVDGLAKAIKRLEQLARMDANDPLMFDLSAVPPEKRSGGCGCS